MPRGSTTRSPAKTSSAARPVKRERARRTPSVRSRLYNLDVTRGVPLEDLMPEVMSVVTPHAEALEAASHPLAALLGERLRQSICRLGPLLEESMTELEALQAASCQVAASHADLRDVLLAASGVLGRTRRGRRVPRQGEFSAGVLRDLPRWQRALQETDSPDAQKLSHQLETGVHALLLAKHAELRARLMLDDAHAVLRGALHELLRVAKDCEAAFPDVARRVVPRPIADAEETDPYQIH